MSERKDEQFHSDAKIEYFVTSEPRSIAKKFKALGIRNNDLNNIRGVRGLTWVIIFVTKFNSSPFSDRFVQIPTNLKPSGGNVYRKNLFRIKSLTTYFKDI